MYEPARRNAAYTLVVGLVLLLYGWMVRPVYSDELGSFYNATLDVFFWTLKLGGGVFVAIGVLSFTGLRVALLLDALASAICGAVMLLCGLYWMKETGFDLSRILFVFFGVMFLRAATGSISLFSGSESAAAVAADAAGPPEHAGGTPADEPAHPASQHPDSLPGEGEPPPPDGYLAALSKDKTEPPDAAFK